MEKEKFIEKAIKIHQNKYDYSKFNYINYNTKIEIICPIHGEFNMTIDNHLHGQGCKKCGIITRQNIRKKSINDFISQANIKHNKKFDYSLVNYVNAYTNVDIICPIHGSFKQKPQVHLNGFGCKKCSGEIKTKLYRSNSENFIDKANIKHNNLYNYSNVKYITSQDKVDIICPIHGGFMQSPNSHLKGRGCPNCGNETKGGWTSTKWLEKANKSKYFDSFKVYLIECEGNGEKFIKIGRTFKAIKDRFDTKIPYNYKLITSLSHEDYKIIFDLETKLKNDFAPYQYIPNLNFGGRYECFNYNILDEVKRSLSIIC